ncbi:ALG13 [Symbiodinium pilosum]|uniref:UDP-N-acetylglucosamine transferase subunit ALG13 n=1 Tax=Symbiodinium pilosum TaxID=2952 RepID=A0A812Q7P6_SYMPI|nr:ALG13 [Symbiodinium pilosum]
MEQSRRHVEELWEPELKTEFRTAFEQESQILEEQQLKEDELRRQQQWAEIARSLTGQWQDAKDGSDAPRCHIIEEVDGALKTWRSDRPSQKAALWLNKDGIVVRGQGNLQLDMVTVGSKRIRWKHRHGDVSEWHWSGHLEEKSPFGNVWCSLPPHSITKPRGAEKRKSVVYKRLGQLVLQAAHRHYLTELVPRTPPSASAHWKEACLAAENAVRRGDVIAAASELATCEDRVVEGRHSLVQTARQFWKQADLTAEETSMLFVSHPALQEKLLRQSWGKREQKVDGKQLRRFLHRWHGSVQDLSRTDSRRWPRHLRPSENATKEQQDAAMKNVMEQIFQAKALSWPRLRSMLVGGQFWAQTRASDDGSAQEVTVGTTSFDDLVKAVDTEAFHEKAQALGFERLVVQFGRGSHRPRQLGLKTESFGLKPSLDEEMKSASLVISHAGAGSVIEALRERRRLLVVVNPVLMNNHQLELAEAMQKRGHCAMAEDASHVIPRLQEAAEMDLIPYPAANLQPWHDLLEESCGVAPAKPPPD